MANPTLIKRLRFRLEIMALRLALIIVPRLPRPLMLKVARIVGRLAYFIDSRGRKVAESNLSIVYPEWTSSTRLKIVRESYQHQTLNAFDLLWASRNLNAETVESYVRHDFEDQDDFEECVKSAAIFITLHYSNFEWLPVVWALTHETKPMTVAQDFKNPAITPIFRSLREYSGVKLISQDRAIIRLLKHLKRGGLTAFVTDLRVKPSKAATIIKTFGLKTSVTIAHGFLAKQTGVPILPVMCHPQQDGTYVFHYYPSFRADTDISPGQIVQQCWDTFEPAIREDPAPWLWMYKHWRHLPKDVDPKDYPDYANFSKAFRKLEES